MEASRAPSSNRTYKSSVKHWYRFCELTGHACSDKSEEIFMRYVAWRNKAPVQVAFNTLKVELNAINALHLRDPDFVGRSNMHRLAKTVAGFRRAAPDPKSREAIPLSLLIKMIRLLDLKDQDSHTFATLLICGFWAMCRIGEMAFTNTPNEHAHTWLLENADITNDPISGKCVKALLFPSSSKTN